MRLPKNYAKTLQRLYIHKNYTKIKEYYDEACRRVSGDIYFQTEEPIIRGHFIKKYIEEHFSAIVL